MNHNDRNIQKFLLLRKTNAKRVLTTITSVILTIYILTSLTACSNNHSSLQNNTMDLLEINSNKINSNIYNQLIEEYEYKELTAWEELKRLLVNDLMRVEELGIIDCRGFDIVSDGLTLKQDISYVILGNFYRWLTYETEKGKCIQRRSGSALRDQPKYLFLNLEDARLLLSAAKGYHFERLGLNQPKISSRRTIFKNNYTDCGGDTIIRDIQGTRTASNNCEEIIFYNYNSNRKGRNYIDLKSL